MDIVQTSILEHNDAEQLLEAAKSITGDPYSDGGAFAIAIEELWAARKLSISQAIREFCANGDVVALHISGVPTGMSLQIATPPIATSAAPKNDFTSEAVILSLAHSLGRVFNFVEEDFGHIVQNVYPIQKHATLQIKSNAVELTMHVDAGCHPLAPDYTTLLCLRDAGDEEVPTTVASMREIVATLNQDEQDILHQPRFVIEQEVAYGAPGRDVQLAIWSTRYGEPAFRFDIPLARGTDAEAQRIVEKLANASIQKRQPVYLASGDILILKNLQCVHGRAAFKPHYDGSDRWLQRVYAWRDMDLLQPVGVMSRGISATVS